MAEQLRIESAIERLEGRLLSLETHPTEKPANTTPDNETPSTVQTRSAKVEAGRRVALAVGEGSALVFLPTDLQSTRAGAWRRQLARLKKFFARTKANAA